MWDELVRNRIERGRPHALEDEPDSRWASNDKACAARRIRAHEGTTKSTAMYFLHYTTHRIKQSIQVGTNQMKRRYTHEFFGPGQQSRKVVCRRLADV